MPDLDRISRIETLWSVVRRAHDGNSDEIQTAQQQLIDRYGGAIQRYLVAATRDEEVAADLYQEFALRFVKGNYNSADPERGRFRSFLKTILYRLVAEHFRKLKRDAGKKSPSDQFDPPIEPDEVRQDEHFAEAWRDELMKRAWTSLAADEKRSGKPHFTLLRLKVASPELTSQELASQAGRQLNRQISTANVRVMVHRARERFADLLLEEVAQSLASPSREEIEQELAELKLLEYCRPVLDRRET